MYRERERERERERGVNDMCMDLNNVQSSFNNEFFSKGKILQELLYKVTAATQVAETTAERSIQ